MMTYKTCTPILTSIRSCSKKSRGKSRRSVFAVPPRRGRLFFLFAFLIGIPVVFNTPVDNSVDNEESADSSDCAAIGLTFCTLCDAGTFGVELLCHERKVFDLSK